MGFDEIQYLARRTRVAGRAFLSFNTNLPTRTRQARVSLYVATYRQNDAHEPFKLLSASPDCPVVLAVRQILSLPEFPEGLGDPDLL
jgi:hypothetical protein